MDMRSAGVINLLTEGIIKRVKQIGFLNIVHETYFYSAQDWIAWNRSMHID